MNAHDIELWTKAPRTAAEAAYRRGLMQGIALSIEALDKGASVAELDDWMLGPIAEWRYQRHGGEIVLPPDWTPLRRASA